MKLKNIILTTLAAIALISCYTSSRISKFSSENIKLGIDKNLFIKRFGKPFNKEISYTQDNQEKEKLFYKEELNKDSCYFHERYDIMFPREGFSFFGEGNLCLFGYVLNPVTHFKQTTKLLVVTLCSIFASIHSVIC